MLAEPFEDSLQRRTAGGKQWPTLNDLESGAVFGSDLLLSKVIGGLENKRYTVIIGAEGRGKTTLARLVGFTLASRNERVYTIDCGTEGLQTADQIATLLVNRDRFLPVWIVDDIQADLEGMAVLCDAIDACSSSRFLFVWRRVFANDRRPTAEADWLEELLERSEIVRIKPDIHTVRGIIAAHLEGSGKDPRASDQPVHDLLTLEDCEWALEITGGNLRTLRGYLDIWNPVLGPLRELRREMVLDSIIEQRLKPLLTNGDETLQTYVDVAGVYQLDVPAWAGAFPASQLQRLDQRGLIANFGGPFYGLAHSSDAKDVVDAFGSLQGLNPKTVTDGAVSRQLSTKQLPFSYMLRLMKAVGDSRSYVPSKRVVEDFQRLALESGNILSMTEHIRAFVGNKEGVRSFVTQMGGSRIIKEIFQQSTMPKVRAFLSFVRRIDSSLARELEAHLTIEDKITLYSRAPLSGIAKSLTFYNRETKSKWFAKQILSRVASEEFRKHVQRSSVAGCGRFMQVAGQIDSTLAASLADVVAEYVSLDGADNAEELSLLISNLRSNESATRRLVERITLQCNPEHLLAHGSANSYTFLLKFIADQYDELPDKPAAERFLEAFTSHFNSERVARLSDRAISAVIWAFLLVRIPIQQWIRSVRAEVKVRLQNTDIENAFWLHWNLLQSDEVLYRELASEAKNNIELHLNSTSPLGAAELAITGVLTNGSIQVLITSKDFSATDVAANLLKQPSAPRIVFALLGAKQIGEASYATLYGELQREAEGFSDLVRDLICQISIKSSRERLMGLAEELGLRAA
jgi:hypothetical protein